MRHVRTGRAAAFGGLAPRLAAALALACALAFPPAALADAGGETLEGEGTFDVVVDTLVDEVVPPGADTRDVVVHVSCPKEGHVAGALVSARLMKPSELASDPAAPPARASAQGSPAVTAKDGTVVLPDAVVGAVYRVTATKDGHADAQRDFTVEADGPAWEVSLEHVGAAPDDRPPAGGDGSGGAPGGAGSASLPVKTGDALALAGAAAALAALAAGILALVARRRRKDTEGPEDGR